MVKTIPTEEVPNLEESFSMGTKKGVAVRREETEMMVGHAKENRIALTQGVMTVNNGAGECLSKLSPRKKDVSKDGKENKQVEGPCSNTKDVVLNSQALKVDQFGCLMLQVSLRTKADAGVKSVDSLIESATGMGAARSEKAEVSTPAVSTKLYCSRVQGGAQKDDEIKEA